MALELIIRPEAEHELAEAYNWYENQVAGLGADFLNTIEASLNGIEREPYAHQIVHNGIRRPLARRFPYAVFYLIKPTAIVVIAVFHVRRNPDSWKNRS